MEIPGWGKPRAAEIIQPSMELTGSICKERGELEHLIHACIHWISHSSSSAVKMMRDPQEAKSTDFQALQAAFAAGGVRLETLRECLAIHQKMHGCGQ
jgi:hypothetical protein